MRKKRGQREETMFRVHFVCGRDGGNIAMFSLDSPQLEHLQYTLPAPEEEEEVAKPSGKFLNFILYRHPDVLTERQCEYMSDIYDGLESNHNKSPLINAKQRIKKRLMEAYFNDKNKPYSRRLEYEEDKRECIQNIHLYSFNGRYRSLMDYVVFEMLQDKQYILNLVYGTRLSTTAFETIQKWRICEECGDAHPITDKVKATCEELFNLSLDDLVEMDADISTLQES